MGIAIALVIVILTPVLILSDIFGWDRGSAILEEIADCLGLEDDLKGE